MAARRVQKNPTFAWLVIIEEVSTSLAYFELATSEQDACNKAKHFLEDPDAPQRIGFEGADMDDIEVNIIKMAERSVYSAVKSGVVLEKIR